MKTITILNFKGGTAKSTTTRNMSAELARRYNKRVLVCDLDSSGNVSAMFGMRPKDGDERCLTQVLSDREVDPREYIVHTSQPGLDLLAGNDTLKPLDTAIRLDTRNPQQFRLARQLKKVSGDYDYCLLDCPPSEDLLVINALACSQEVIIPAQVNQDDLEGAIRVKRLVREIQDYNPGLIVRGLLFTRVGTDNTDKDGAANLMLPGVPRFQTYIRNSIHVKRSRFAMKSLAEYKEDEKCKPFGPLYDYENFVAEYLGKPRLHDFVPYNPDYEQLLEEERRRKAGAAADK